MDLELEVEYGEYPDTQLVTTPVVPEYPWYEINLGELIFGFLLGGAVGFCFARWIW